MGTYKCTLQGAANGIVSSGVTNMQLAKNVEVRRVDLKRHRAMVALRK